MLKMAAILTKRLQPFLEEMQLGDAETFVETQLRPKGIINLANLLSLSTDDLKAKLPDFYLQLKYFVEQLAVDEQLLNDSGIELADLLSRSREDLAKNFPIFHPRLRLFIEQLVVDEQLLNDNGIELADLLSRSREDLAKNFPIFHPRLRLFIEQLPIDDHLVKALCGDLKRLLSFSDETLANKFPIAHENFRQYINQLPIDDHLVKALCGDLKTLLSFSNETLAKNFPILHPRLRLFIEQLPVDEQFLRALGVFEEDIDNVKNNLKNEKRGSVNLLISGFENVEDVVKRIIGRPSAEVLWRFIEKYRETSTSTKPNQAQPKQLWQITEKTLSTWVIPVKGSIRLHPVNLRNNPHAEKFRLAGVPGHPADLEKPFMLLYGLGDGMMVSNEKIEKFRLANAEKPILLFGPSGAGKTRLCYELLNTHYGLYLIAKRRSDKNPGSSALMEIADLVENAFVESRDKYEWQSLDSVARKTAPVSGTAFDSRRQLAEFGVKCVIAAYCEIFNRLGGAEALSPREWLLVQLFPGIFLGIDYFSKLATDIFRNGMISLQPEARVVFKHVVLDEANILDKVMVNGFFTSAIEASSNQGRPRSVDLRSFISPVLSTLNTWFQVGPIVSGTGVSLVGMFQSFESGMGVENTYQRVRYSDFPPLTYEQVSNLLKRLLVVSDISDIERAASWLEGRPRFCMGFLTAVVLESPYAVTEHLVKYVSRMTEDVEKNSLLEAESPEARTPRHALDRLKTPTRAQADHSRDRDLRTSALLGLFFVEYGVKNVVVVNGLPLIELGLAYPGKQENANMAPEPLVLQAGRQSRSDGFLDQHMETTSDDPGAAGNRFEYVVADRILPKFFNGILEKSPLVHRLRIPAKLKGEWNLAGPSFGRVAEWGGDGHAFYKWVSKVINLEEWNKVVPPLGMMLPDRHLGPDIVAVLLQRDQKTQKVIKVALLFVQVKYLSTPVNGVEAVRTVDPALFHHTKRGKDQPQPIESYRERHQIFLKSIEHIPAVRVVVSGTSEVKKLTPVITKRGSMEDLCLVLDTTKRDLAAAMGKTLSNVVKRQKGVDDNYDRHEINL